MKAARRREPAGGRASFSPLIASIDHVHDGAPHRVKDEEKARIYQAICTERTPTRQGIARRLSLRPSSVSDAVQELVDDGLVREAQAPSRGRSGRPQSVLTPRKDRFTAVSLYVDSRELKGVLATPFEETLAEEARSLSARAGNAETAAALRAIIDSLIRRVPEASACVGVGLSLVGTVDPAAPAWVAAARWPMLSGLDLSFLSKETGLPLLVRRTNETELEYCLECASGAAAARCGGVSRGRVSRARPGAPGTSLLLHWGFGIGSAAAHDGRLLSSTLGRFGEIGHTRAATGSTARCLCGQRGCLETVASLWALMPLLRGKLGELPEDEKALAPYLAAPKLLRLPEMRGAVEAVREALIVLCKVLYPDTVLLSGPFTENRILFESVTNGLLERLPEYPRGSLTITRLPGGMRGCRRGGANPLLRQALARALRRRT